MQEASSTTVLGDFNNATFNYQGTTTTFFKKDDAFWVKTDNEKGELTDYPVAFVFGVYPLQQLLIPLSKGRLNALSIAWDARKALKAVSAGTIYTKMRRRLPMKAPSIGPAFTTTGTVAALNVIAPTWLKVMTPRHGRTQPPTTKLMWAVRAVMDPDRHT
jgi:hypothetical protein